MPDTPTHRWLIRGLLMLAGLLLAAQSSSSIRFERLSMGDGLAQSSISAMLQDRDGFLWFGTQYGLSRFDGYGFETFRHRPEDAGSLDGSNVASLLLSRDGQIWVTTHSGLNRFDPATGQAVRYGSEVLFRGASLTISRQDILGEAAEGDLYLLSEYGLSWLPEGKASPELMAFDRDLSALGLRGMQGLLDSSGRPWLINDAGLWFLDKAARVMRSVPDVRPALGRAPQHSLAETAAGLIALADSEGLVLVDSSRSSISQVVRPVDHGFPDNRIDAVAATDDGSIWMTSGNSLIRFQPATGDWQVLYRGQPLRGSAANPMALVAVQLRPGEFWFASQFGVSRWIEGRQSIQPFLHRPGDDSSVPQTLRSAAYSLFVDRDETLWVGSQLGGLARLPAHAGRFEHIVDQSAPGTTPFAGQNVVRAIAEQIIDGEERVWVALDTAGLRQYRRAPDGELELIRAYNTEAAPDHRLPGNQVGALAVDPLSNTVWIGEADRLLAIDGLSGRVLSARSPASYGGSGSIRALRFSADGSRLWVGHSGLDELHIGNDRLLPRACPNGPYLPQSGLLNLLELPDERLIVGGYSGFAVVDFHAGRDQLMLHSRYHPLEDGHEVFGLASHGEQGFWIGTREHGLGHVRLMSGSVAPRIDWYRREQGLVDETIYAILPQPDGRLWMSSNQGLMHFNPVSGEVRHFTPPDGVQHFEFNRTVAHIGASGRYYFGGINGANSFRPERIRLSATPPRLYLTDLRINGQPRPVTIGGEHSIELGYGDNDLEVAFVGLHSADPSRHRYQHWLEGLDEEWRSASYQREVRYAGLPPGQYRLWVRAANSDGVWSEQEPLLTASINPPPWATAWAYLAYVLAGLATLGLFWLLARRRATQLESEVRERTRELIEQQALIRRQARELKRALDSRTEFFANVSHEFRTPLTLIRASLDELADTAASAAALERAGHYLDRLVRLVDQLLDLSALQAERLDKEGEPWSISSMLELMVRSFAPLADQRGISLDGDIRPDCVTRRSQHHIEQIALNLISNALKYGPQGSRVRVSLMPLADGLQLIVADTGPGIEPADQEAIFERFHRAEQARQSGQAGAGIGLALVRETAEALGGSIALDSAPGCGSRFRVCLPGEYAPGLVLNFPANDLRAFHLEASQLALPPTGLAADQSDDQTRAQFEEQNDVADEDGEAETILVVEDQPDLQAHLAELLGQDWQMLSAGSGEAALELARQHVPDLIVSDVMMPGMDGFQLLSALRDDRVTSHIPVLLLTARHDRVSRLKGLSLSADDFMGKPFDGAELKIRLKRMLANRRRLQRHLLDRGRQGMEPPIDHEDSPDWSARDRALIEALEAWLDARAEDSAIKVEDLASGVAMETRTLQRKIRALTGQTPSDFIRHFRLQRAVRLLLETDRSINDIALSCGFSSPQSFSRTFSRQYGQPPERWRRTQDSAVG